MNVQIKLRLKVLMVVAVTALSPAFIRCAHPVTPTGGPKDITPPAVTKCVPENYSANFTEKKLVIEFNEYIVLKDAAKEIFTSPPMVKRPEYIVRGKSLVVEFKEELRENSTYVIYFGNAITDLAEGNPLKGYSYVFSTGAVIDSMLIAGSVVTAFDLKPVEGIIVSVYSAGQDTMPLDSMPKKIPPLSAIRTGADGTFRLSNLPDKDFLLFALEDLNNNFYYDLPEEKIGFLDSLVRPEWIPALPDTVEQDSLEGTGLAIAPEPKQRHTIYLFQETDSTQRMLSTSFTPAGSIMLAFRIPAKGLVIEPLNFPADRGWMMEEYSANKDTLTLWPMETGRDTFRLRILLPPAIDDTVRLLRKKTETAPGRKKVVAPKSLEYKASARAGILEPQKEFSLAFIEPVVKSDLSNIRLIDDKDTLTITAAFTDTIHRRLLFEHKWQENRTYKLTIPDSTLTGLSGKMNGEISQTFRTKPLSDYGTMIMDYIIPAGNHDFIVELLGDKDMVIQRDTLRATSKITYTHMKPGAYRLKAISDQNGNGRWDPGNYDLKQLPEKVTYFQKEITVRSNWEIQDEWKLFP
jgi:hypothetical protein